MFGLAYGFVQYMMQKDEYHILIVGLDRAGKTNVLEKLKTLLSNAVALEPAKIVPTVGLNVGKMEQGGTHLVFWDLGGSTSLRSIWDKYYHETHGVVYVVDAVAKDRLVESRQVLDKLLLHPDLKGAPLLVLANKQDAPGAVDMREVAEQLGMPTPDGRACIVQPASAHTGEPRQPRRW
jgi:ADP-ribosylation factor related protein 1